MAKPMIRVAAGAAAAFAIMVAGGLGAAVTSADTGQSRSSSSQSSAGGHSGGAGHAQPSRVHGSRDGDLHGNQRKDADGRGDSRGYVSTGVTAGQGTSIDAAAQTTAASRGAVAEQVTPAVAATVPAVVPVPAATVPAVVAATVPAASQVRGSSAASGAGPSATPIVLPRPTLGNGRSPTLSAAVPAQGDLVSVIDPRPALPVSHQPALERSSIVSPRPLRMESIPWPLTETPVTSLWGKVEPGWPAGVLFGIAGLLLAPIGGVWLGQRQARAARAAAQLVVH